jgi:ABC-type nickel/cobalt efflux system permease component RcnA
MAYEEQREKSRKMLSVSSSLIDGFLGLLMIAVGTILVKKDHFNIRTITQFVSERDPFLIQIFGCVCIVYGLWRLYRGYVKIKEQ